MKQQKRAQVRGWREMKAEDLRRILGGAASPPPAPAPELGGEDVKDPGSPAEP